MQGEGEGLGGRKKRESRDAVAGPRPATQTTRSKNETKSDAKGCGGVLGTHLDADKLGDAAGILDGLDSVFRGVFSHDQS